MRTIPLVLTIGTPKEYPVSARYFRLLTTLGAVDVSLMKGGREVYEAVGVEAGFWATPDGGFDQIRVTSGTNQTIVVAVTSGNGGYDRSAGSVSVTSQRDTNGNSIDSVAISASPVLATRKLVVQEGGFAYGASYVNATPLAANTPATIFAAGANVNGAIVWAAQILGYGSASSGRAVIAANTVAPANITTGDVLLAVFYGNASVLGPYFPQLLRPVFIPAGRGLYSISEVAEGSRHCSVLYTLL